MGHIPRIEEEESCKNIVRDADALIARAKSFGLVEGGREKGGGASHLDSSRIRSLLAELSALPVPMPALTRPIETTLAAITAWEADAAPLLKRIREAEAFARALGAFAASGGVLHDRARSDVERIRSIPYITTRDLNAIADALVHVAGVRLGSL